ncbi:TonB-dependent receptor plug domain-containing protein [Bacteroides ovatus]|nr:TonB-dependent receptor plug domain-containing protein [Bacteroides ovatus]
MVKAEAIENRPITNVTTGLQGLLPGVSIVSSSGQPGAVPSINIRGTGTINSSTAPLILIDGVAGGRHQLIESFGHRKRIRTERCRLISYLWSTCR